jgi:hypothetical protein
MPESIHRLSVVVQKIINSETFKRSPERQRLLAFVAQKTLELGPKQVSGKLLESDFFKLPDESSTEKSSTCRVQISRIKNLLDSYYDSEGLDDPWHIAFENGFYGLTLKPGTADQSSFAPRLCILPMLNLGGDSRQ